MHVELDNALCASSQDEAMLLLDCRWNHKLRIHADRCLRTLQNHQGLLKTASAWWMLLVVLWAASALPF